MIGIFKNFIRNYLLLYRINTFVVSVILIFFINISFAEENNENPLNLWENDSLLSNENKNKLKNKPLDEIKKEEISSGNQEVLDKQNKIDQNNINISSLDSIGVYDETNGGFSIGIWKNSKIDQIEYLLNELPKDLRNNFLIDTVNKSLLTISSPPIQNDSKDKIFFDLKINYFERAGNYNDFDKLYNLVDEEDIKDELLLKYVDSKLIKGDYKSSCKTLNKINSQQLKLELNSFCKAMANNLPALDLMISLLSEEGSIDKELLNIYYAYINKTQINFEDIKEFDIKKLNLISNLGIDYSNIINENSPIEFQLFFVYSKLKTNEIKVAIAENLLANKLIESTTLGNLYKEFYANTNVNTSVDYIGMESSMKKRQGVYNQIRNTSDQSKLPKLLNIFVSEMGKQELLINGASLVYDKAKIITPKQSHRNEVVSICVILLINNDIEKCNEWLEVLKFDKESKEIIKVVEFYLSLKSLDKELRLKVYDQADLYLQIMSLDETSKNVLAKYFMLRQKNQLLNFWSIENDSIRNSGLTINIKLTEYLKQIKNISIGEALLLLCLIYGNNQEHLEDTYALFSVIEALDNIKKEFTDEFIFEYFANNLI